MIILSVDVETTPFSMLSPEITLIGVYNGLTTIFFDDIYSFRQFINKSTKDTILVAHNLQFDFNMLYPFEEICKIKDRIIYDLFAINGEFPRFSIGKIVHKQSLEGKKGRGNTPKSKLTSISIYWIDLMNFMPFALKDLMQIFTPDLVKHKVDDFSIERNTADIIATREIYANHFFKTNTKYHKERPFLSIASLSYNDLIETTHYEWEDKDSFGRNIRPQYLKEIEKESYRGAIIFPNPKFLNQAKYCFGYDVNSMYASVMREMKVATGLIKMQSLILNFDESKTFIEKSFNNNNTLAYFYVTAKTLVPILPTKINNKLELPIGEIRGWYSETELYYALNKGKQPKITDLNILKICLYKATKGLFKPFIDKHYSVKETIDKERQELIKLGKTLQEVEDHRNIERSLAKIYPNASYGRFGMKKRESEVLYNDVELLQEILKEKSDSKLAEKLLLAYKLTCEKIDEYTDKKGRLWKVRRENNLIFLERRLEEEAKGSITIIASETTSTARAKLMEKYDMETTLYCDTDSLFSLEKMESSTELGGWKLEKEGVLVVKGKKDYVFDDKPTLKGVPIKKKNELFRAKQLSEDYFSYYKVLRPREANIRKLPIFSMIKVYKQLKRNKEVKK